jgi:dolichyl-phosphate-mannose-protein mannosyltransferase
MVHPDSQARPQRWTGPALAAVLLASLALRMWDASADLDSNRYFDEQFILKNVTALLKHGDFRPRHAFYLSLSYLPQAAVLGATQSLYRVTRYPPFSIYKPKGDGYSPTALWLCRMMSVAYGVLSLWLLYLIGRRIYSPEVGLLAAAILAAFPRHLLSSVEIKPDILVILLVVLTLYWTLGAAFRPRLARFLLVGFGVGLAVSTKYTGIAAAFPITGATVVNGRRDRRQWGWLVLAGLTSIVTFVILNPFLGVVFPFIPKLVRGYAAKGVEEKSNHWVVFERQIEFLIEHHGPIVAAFVGLGVVWLLWRIVRPVAEDSEERRLGTILVLSLLLGHSALHSLGMTLFRGQNYLPVVPASSLVAAWAMVELWRTLARRLRWLAWQPVPALLGIGVVAALFVQQASLVYIRVTPTNLMVANQALLGRLQPFGLRHVVYEHGMGRFQVAGKPRRPLVTRLTRLTDVGPSFLDRTDVEIFPQHRLAGPQAAFYRNRLARVPKNQVEVFTSQPFHSRGEPAWVLSHLWMLDGPPVDLRVRRPEGAPYLVGRFPEGSARPGDTVSLLLWVPRELEKVETFELRIDPGDRLVPVFDTGRRLTRYFRLSPRFDLTGKEIRVRIPVSPEMPPRGFGLEVYRWRALTSPPPHTPATSAPPPASE